ncbi:MAG: glycosyltransferase family 2 protein [Oscillospiraceae bacterium]|jgi:glycosyltransferase involved in cell wall biosynthesis|nr:glycosyltransferase family 2 protein [Oscillospiraceae bacterium]
MMKLSLIVPCYNEEGNIKRFHSDVKKVFTDAGFNFEIIFINDGSSDDTLKNLKYLHSESDLNIKIIDFSRNFGKESAIYAGIKESEGDYICLIDSDLQHDPALVLEMIKTLDENQDYDCVATYQEKRKEDKLLVFFKNSFYKIINSLTHLNFVNGASDFRTFRRSMADAILSMGEYQRFTKGIFAWIGFNTHYIPYQVNERFTGKSKWSFFKLLFYALDGITSFTTLPLQVSTIIGLISTIFSSLYLIVVVIQKLFFSINIPGYATIVVLILFLGSLQLLALGTIGKYLAKTYIQGKNRPIYIAKEIIGYKTDQ